MDSTKRPANKIVNILQEFSIPLLAGVAVALLMANLTPHLYHGIVHTPFHRLDTMLSGDGHGEQGGHGGGANAEGDEDHGADHDAEGDPEGAAHGDHADGADHGVGGDSDPDPDLDPETAATSGGDVAEGHVVDGPETHHGSGADHYLTLHFLINDIFMVIFFGIAAKEIAESCLPGGSLNPVNKAINPLLGTIGGVAGPVGMYFLLNYWIGQPDWVRGWGIPTATDIALAWLVARWIFGQGHPAISFLLLLAVVDDAIGLVIIAIFYPDPTMPTEWLNTLWILPGMALCWWFRRRGVQDWFPYIACGGILSWYGLHSAHLHPALALVPIVPFLPGPDKDLGMFVESSDYERKEEKAILAGKAHGHSPLESFEHDLKLFVDMGLFFFAFANAGVVLSDVNNLTWIVLLALLVGKTLGITLFSYAGVKLGFPLPTGMDVRHLAVAGMIAGIGLTVALFVAGEAFTDTSRQGAAKMGALLSGVIAFAAYLTARAIGIRARKA